MTASITSNVTIPTQSTWDRFCNYIANVINKIWNWIKSFFTSQQTSSTLNTRTVSFNTTNPSSTGTSSFPSNRVPEECKVPEECEFVQLEDNDPKRNNAIAKVSKNIQKQCGSTPSSGHVGIQSFDLDSTSPELKEACQTVQLFLDKDPAGRERKKDSATTRNILGFFDCLAMQITIALNNNWDPYPPTQTMIPFDMLYLAMPNVRGKLKKELYRKNINHLLNNMFEAAKARGYTHMVIPALGGGAFTKGLSLDDRKEARRQVAQELIQLAPLNIKIFICIPNSTDLYTIYREKLSRQPNKKIKLKWNADAPIFAQHLKNIDPSRHVAFVNAGCLFSIGNRYFIRCASKAIDENCLRRANPTTQSLAYIINGGKNHPAGMSNWVCDVMGGQVTLL